MRKIRLHFSFQTILPRLPLLAIVLTVVTLFWVTAYLYARLYKPITQTETIILIRSETALQLIDIQLYENLKKLQNERQNVKPLNIPQELNPFLSD